MVFFNYFFSAVNFETKMLDNANSPLRFYSAILGVVYRILVS